MFDFHLYNYPFAETGTFWPVCRRQFARSFTAQTGKTPSLKNLVVSVNRGNNGFGAMPRASAGVILLAFRQGRRRRLPCQRPRHCSKTPKDRSPAPQGQVCKATGRRLASASRGRERGKRGFAAAGRRCFPLFTDATLPLDEKYGSTPIQYARFTYCSIRPYREGLSRGRY